MTHELKCDPLPFAAICSGEKTFELRKNDRDFKVGDAVVLKETRYSREQMVSGSPLEYTGSFARFEITHLMLGPIWGLAADWCIMSLKVRWLGGWDLAIENDKKD